MAERRAERGLIVRQVQIRGRAVARCYGPFLCPESYESLWGQSHCCLTPDDDLDDNGDDT